MDGTVKTKKIIPCLDTMNGRTVKGVNFVDIQDAGDIIELATLYEQQGADELVLLDITATVEGRKTTLDWISDVAKTISIPFTIGGGIGSVEDAANLLAKGASKISINSKAVANPNLISEISQKLGKDKLVVAIDGKLVNGNWEVVVSGGTKGTGINVVDWAREVDERGAGEILFTSMSHDGTKSGFPNDVLAAISDAVSIPIIASGGAGTMEHFYEAFTVGKADAGLAASVFHFGEISIPELKEYLSDKGISIKK